MIARELDLLPPTAATEVHLYDASDLPWIAIVVDCVMTCLGLPWRVLQERLEHAPIRGPRVAAILGAMRRMMDGRAQRTKIARKVRASVLGHPVLDDAARTERLASAGDELGIDPSEIESLLWIDLADERPVILPDGRPDESRLAAYANVDRIQRALRRAKHVRIHAWGNAHPLIRMASRYGLLVRVSSNASTRDDVRALEVGARLDASRRDAHTIIDIVGPLSLFHQTHVYGRALGSVVPLLSGLDRFVVEIDADFGYGIASLRLASPVLLPPAPTERGKPSIATKIANALDRVRDLVVERDPPPIAHGIDRLFPDLAIEVTDPVSPPKGTKSARSSKSGRRGAESQRESDEEIEHALETERPFEDDRDLFPDLTALLASQMSADAERIASDQRDVREGTIDGSRGNAREIVAKLPVTTPDRSRCWFVEVVGFATTEYLTAKLARYAAAGIERVVLVVDDTRAPDLADVRRVIAYRSQTTVVDLLAILQEAP